MTCLLIIAKLVYDQAQVHARYIQSSWSYTKYPTIQMQNLARSSYQSSAVIKRVCLKISAEREKKTPSCFPINLLLQNMSWVSPLNFYVLCHDPIFGPLNSTDGTFIAVVKWKMASDLLWALGSKPCGSVNDV